MKVLDIALIEIVPGNLRLEEDVPLLGQAQTALLLVRVVAVPPCLDGSDYPAMSYLFVTNKNQNATKLSWVIN